MKKIFGTAPLFILLAFASCKKVDIVFGTEFLENENTQLIKIDSFGVDLSTVMLDSFITSGKNVALVGAYTDPLFGKIAARTFFQIAPAGYSDIFQNTAFDSIALIGKVNGTYYGDSTLPLRLNVARLQQDIVPPSTGTSLYNVNSFAAYSSLLGSQDVRIRPTANDSFSIKLTNALGNEFMDMLKRGSDTIKTSTVFLNYFKGITISTTTTNAMVVGLNDTLKVRLYYRKAGLVQENKYFDFDVNNASTLQFNNITVDRTGTALQNIASTANKELSSTVTNHTAYSQPITSTMVKMRFPTVKEMLKLTNYKKLLKAQLVVRPAAGSYSSIYRLPPELRLSKTTQLNQIGESLTTTVNGTATTQTGELVTDYLYGKDTYYTYDISNYILEVIATDGYTQNGLLLLPPSPSAETTFNRVVVGDRNNGDYKIELQIFYVTVQ